MNENYGARHKLLLSNKQAQPECAPISLKSTTCSPHHGINDIKSPPRAFAQTEKAL